MADPIFRSSWSARCLASALICISAVSALLLWATARKLFLHIPRRGRHLVWCLPLEDLHFLYICFDWQLVSPERRIHSTMLWKKEAKHLISSTRKCRIYTKRGDVFSSLFSRTWRTLRQVSDILLRSCPPLLDSESRAWLDAHFEYGYYLCKEFVIQARQVLHDQADLPIVDAILVTPGDSQVETFSMLLLPFEPREESEQLFLYISQWISWYQGLLTFLESQGLSTS